MAEKRDMQMSAIVRCKCRGSKSEKKYKGDPEVIKCNYRPLPGCHEMSPNFVLEGFVSLPVSLPCSRGVEPSAGAMLIADVSDAVRLARFGAMLLLFGVSVPFKADLLEGFKAGASAGRISLANSRTRTAPSSLLSFATISCSPYLSTKIARLGWTSHTVRKMRKRLSRTTALLCANLSMTRLKNWDLAVPIVMRVDIRQILRKGSRRFSNELALADTKHLRSASSASGFMSSSSNRAVSSWSQDRIASRALTWKYGSSRSFKYRTSPSCCHSKTRQLFPAPARSQRIGKANCFKGELVSITRLRDGMIPAWAASSCLDLFKRQRL